MENARLFVHDDDEFDRQRLIELEHIETETTALASVMQKLSTLIFNQSPLVDNIAHNIDQSLDQVERGGDYIQSACDNQKRKRDACCWVLVILFGIGVFIVVLLTIN